MVPGVEWPRGGTQVIHVHQVQLTGNVQRRTEFSQFCRYNYVPIVFMEKKVRGGTQSSPAINSV